MSDLVKRIRDYPGERIAGSYELREQAADRIEALEAELSTAQQVIYDLTEGITGTIQCDRIEALEAALRGTLAYEVEKAKLNGFSDCTCMGHSREAETTYETGQCPHQIARAALAPACLAEAERRQEQDKP